MRFFKIFFYINLCLQSCIAFADYFQCHPKINLKMQQYIIGYGSLMLEASKLQTDSFTHSNIPILLSGYERGWIIHGFMKTKATTFLGIREDLKDKILNAVMFRIDDSKQIMRLDEREKGYCRKLVDLKNIKMLLNKPMKLSGQLWVYIPRNKKIERPSREYPMSTYYIDIFIAGCIDIEKKYKLKGFAKQCLTSTRYWDRTYDPNIPNELKPLRFDRKKAHQFLIKNL
jgi:hypothetical protein